MTTPAAAAIVLPPLCLGKITQPIQVRGAWEQGAALPLAQAQAQAQQQRAPNLLDLYHGLTAAAALPSPRPRPAPVPASLLQRTAAARAPPPQPQPQQPVLAADPLAAALADPARRLDDPALAALAAQHGTHLVVFDATTLQRHTIGAAVKDAARVRLFQRACFADAAAVDRAAPLAEVALPADAADPHAALAACNAWIARRLAALGALAPDRLAACKVDALKELVRVLGEKPRQMKKAELVAFLEAAGAVRSA
jgi:hypothetical protein